jgi:hypothetical protein
MDPGAEDRVVGYYAICPTVVIRDDMPKSLQRGVLRAAPAWLLTKLALDKSLRGDKDHQWGAQLLREALEKIVASVDLGGGQIIVVDADNPGLIGWYPSQGFKSTGGQDLRLFMKVATARKRHPVSRWISLVAHQVRLLRRQARVGVPAGRARPGSSVPAS